MFGGLIMEIRTLCKNCKKYYVFFDDFGDVLVEGCKLDLPIFNAKNPIICNSYNDK